MQERFVSTVRDIREVATADAPPSDRLQHAMELIHQDHPHYEWVGVYILRDVALELGAFVGAPTEHTRIPIGRGVCGTAAATRANQIIEDVRKLDNYLACSATVRSEIVVLVWDREEIIGGIDADCDETGAFTAADEKFLTVVAAILAPLVRAVQ